MTHSTIQARYLQRHLASPATQAPLVVDIRSRRQFRRHHIPGSQNIPAARLISTEFPDRDMVLVGNNDAETSPLVEQLYDHGYPRRIQQLQGGLKDWSEAGLPLGGDDPMRNRERNLPIPWLTIAAVGSLLLGLQTLSPGLLVISLLLLLAPPLTSSWLQRNLFRLQRKAS